MRDPGNEPFTRFEVGGAEVFVAHDVLAPTLNVRRSHLFPWRLVAEWPDAASGGNLVA